MTPSRLHAVVLLALDAAGGAIADATAAPWSVDTTAGPQGPASILGDPDAWPLAYGIPGRDARLVVGLRNTASAALRGARRIIERHAPQTNGPDLPVCCARCAVPRVTFPCVDYRDAAKIIPNLPQGVVDVLNR